TNRSSAAVGFRQVRGKFFGKPAMTLQFHTCNRVQMKLCRYWLPDSGPTLGLVDGSLVYNVADADADTFGSFSRMLGLELLPDRAERAAARVRSRAGFLWNDLDVAPDVRKPHLLAPVTKQEVWAAGVTYLRSREARMEESAGGG